MCSREYDVVLLRQLWQALVKKLADNGTINDYATKSKTIQGASRFCSGNLFGNGPLANRQICDLLSSMIDFAFPLAISKTCTHGLLLNGTDCS